MERKVVAKYDKEFDTLYIFRPDIKPKGAVEIGNFIVEFAPELQKVAALEILDATRVFSTVFGKEITKSMLEHIVAATLRTVSMAGAIYVQYMIVCTNAQKEEITIENAVALPMPA